MPSITLTSTALGAALGAFLLLCLWLGHSLRRMRRDRRLRVVAEAAASQADRLAQLTDALGQARTPRAVIEAALQEPMYALRADAGMLLITSRDGESAEVKRAVGYSYQPQPSIVELSKKDPLADAVGRGAPVILESRQAWMAEYPDEGLKKEIAFQATAVVPLLIGSRVVAIVRLDFHEARLLTADDRKYLFALGTRAAQALDRTWQLEAAERARSDAEALQSRADRELVERRSIEHALRASETRYRALATRTSRLHALTAALSEAVTVEAMAHAVVDHGRTVLGATAGEVMLLVENGATFETLYAQPERQDPKETHRIAVGPGLCAAEVIQTSQPIFIRSFPEWQQRFWRSASFAADNGYQSSATMPLLVEGAAIGVIAFHFSVPVNFDDDYQTLLMSVARHCAQALDRARLYESAQQAKADAEAANRSKDEFVSTISHELRGPLTAILGWARMLQAGSLEPRKAVRALQSICDNATRQAKLIEELLDFSRLASGRATLEMGIVEIREVIRGVVESMIPTASARGVQLQLSSVPPVAVIGDIRRLEQVFFNLIGNALKFTPEDGHVIIAVRLLEGRVEIAIKDDGAGIDPEFLAFVFDRFRQGDSSTSGNQGGLGLGLAISKELVQAHNGTISAESDGRGRGSTFTVTLPLAASDPSDSSRTGDGAPEERASRLDGAGHL